MVVDHKTGLSADMGVTDDMMAHPDPRVPLIDPFHYNVHFWPKAAVSGYYH